MKCLHFTLSVTKWNAIEDEHKKLLIETYMVNEITSEAVSRRCSVEKVFLKISQILQENTCARVSFSIKLQSSGLPLYQKRDSGTGVFLCILLNFQERFFYRTPPVAASIKVTPYLTLHNFNSWPFLFCKNKINIELNVVLHIRSADN